MSMTDLVRRVAELQEEVNKLNDKVRALEDFKLKLFAYGTVIMFVIGVITGGGDVSLKHWMGH